MKPTLSTLALTLTLAITHKSNASVSSFNPGVNAVLLRYHVFF